MRNEEAIKKLQEQQAEFNERYVDFAGMNEAYNMAIEALMQQAKTHFYFACPKCGYASITPCGTDTRPDGSEPGEQINNKTTAQWIRKNNRFICPFCDAETEKYFNWCPVCEKELM